MLLYLPPMTGQAPGVKDGPALTGHGAEAVRDAIARTIVTLPEQLRRSLTWDQGTEMAQHAQLRIETGLPVYLCRCHHRPWQRGTNENTNGLLRQYFPKGTDLSRHSAEDLAAVASALNSRPRKTLSWKTPAEALNEYLKTYLNQPRTIGRRVAAAQAPGPLPPGSRSPPHPSHRSRRPPKRRLGKGAITAETNRKLPGASPARIPSPP